MKRAFAWVLVFLLIIVGAIIGTIAYLTDENYANNVFTVGNIDIELLEYERINIESTDGAAKVEEFDQNKPFFPAVLANDFNYTPGDTYVDWTQDFVKWHQDGESGYTSEIWNPANINNEIDKMVFVKNTGTNSAYVRNFFAFEAGAYTSFEQFKEKIHLNLNETDWEWKWEEYIAKIGNTKYFIATATYKYPLAPGEFTEISLSQIALDSSATNADVKAFGPTYNIPIITQGVQTATFDDPFTALSTAFGDDIPFEGITFDKGVTASTSLHYFEGNVAGTKITDKVTSVIYGTKSDYPEISGAYSGTLTSNDPGAPAHTYYVPDGENYKLYVLADEGKVYAPEICQDLFNGMSALTMVDAANLDVSNVTNMQSMFRYCRKLKELDVSNWDVSKVTTMYLVFESCNALDGIDVSNWNVGNVTNMSNMFRSCTNLTTLNVSNWNTENVSKIDFMFHSCKNLENIDVSRWNVSKVTNMCAAFEGCAKFTTIDVGNWDVSKVVDAKTVFAGCSALESADVSKWELKSVTEMRKMFQGCGKLSSPMDLSKWDVSKVKDMQYLFDGCKSVPSLNVSGWNVAKVTNFTYVFSGCSSLTELDVKNWDVSSATSMQGMFYNCSGLPSLDLSTWGEKLTGVTGMEKMFWGCSSLTSLNVSVWDVSTVTNMYGMFRACSSLNSLDISDWDVTSLTNATEMFTECSGLTQLDLSGWDTENLVSTESMFKTCSNLTTIYVSETWKMNKVTNSAHMFDNCFKLVGGENTKFVSNITDKTYARIDGGTSAPGYLTHKEHTPTTP